VTRSIANAEQFAAWVSCQRKLELVAPVNLNIVCFRVRETTEAGDADHRTADLTERIQRGGVAHVTSTRWQGRTAILAAFDNWATTDSDVTWLQRAVESALAEIFASDSQVG
jgi:aromatic-L-amino-acid decarboxylase